MCETYLRLLALGRMIERRSAPFGTIGTDAALDAWFGASSPVFPAPQRVAHIPARRKPRPAE